MKRISFALTLTAGALALALGQTQSAAGQQSDVNVTVTTAEVLLDTVVRDKKGRVVKNLTASDFEVYEDGVRQQIKSLRFVARDDSPGGATTEEKSNRDSALSEKIAGKSANGASALAFVFDRLKPESRGIVRKAATSYVNNGGNAADIVGVFAVDQSLRVVQPFTNNKALIQQGVERASSLNSSTYYLGSELNRAPSRGVHAPTAFGGQTGLDREGPVGAAAAAPGPGNETGIAAAIMAGMTTRSLEIFERLERDQQGFATTGGMLAVIESLRTIPGRKAIVLFSDGLAIPSAVEAQFQSLISTANRANVSIYAVDAAGLRAESGAAESRRQLRALGAKSADRGNSSGEDTSGQPLTRDLERNEDLIRFDPQSGLGQLSDQTGGFLIRDTNDLEGGLRRIEEDLAAYYVLSYTPQNQEYDGRLRRIEVKLKRSGLDVQSRKGYYAVNGSFPSPVLSYEAPALAIAGRNLRPSELVVRGTALSFPESARPGLVPIVIEVPARFITFAANEGKKSYGADFAIVVLVKDENKQIIRKLSGQYQLAGAIDKLQAERQADVLFYRETELPAGSYTIETIVHDALGGKAGWHQSSLEVPVVDNARPRLSSIVTVKRAEKLSAGERKDSHPLHFGELLLYPSVNEPFQKSVSKEIPFFFTAYGTGAGSSKFVAELTKDEQLVGKTANSLPGADAQGRVQYASAFPSEKFEPGEYQLNITLTTAQGSSSRSTKFTVEP